MLSQSD